ncbi:hypothetical protein B0H11DRAFT_2077887 [Mycena galericulata]|nr:hypothetical protein B0H11DRAFT_2077887 [Mycena galericulata]
MTLRRRISTRLNHLLSKLRFKLSFRNDAIALGSQQASSRSSDTTLDSEHTTLESEQTPPRQTPGSTSCADPRYTARNVLEISLQTLGAISSDISLGQSLSSVIDPVLAVMTRIEPTSDNAQGFVELAARIKLLTPIISEMGTRRSPSPIDVASTPNDSPDGHETPSKGQFVLEALRQEFESMTKDLNAAKSRGMLEGFFDSADNAACLTKHNTNLTQIIAMATLVEVEEVSQTFKNLESKLGEHGNEAQIQIQDVTGEDSIQPRTDLNFDPGGVGAPGSSGNVGGEGGEGVGPRLEPDCDDRVKLGNISGGTGGAGGAGLEVGGKGGTGKGPVIKVQRRSKFESMQPLREQKQQEYLRPGRGQ